MIATSESQYRYHQREMAVLRRPNGSKVPYEIKDLSFETKDLDYEVFFSEDIKYIVRFAPSAYHLLLDTIGIILSEHAKNPNIFFIIDMSEAEAIKDNYGLYDLLFKVVNSKNIQYAIANIREKPLAINNFLVVDPDLYGIKKISSISEVINCLGIEAKDNKKVYVSRSRSQAAAKWGRPDILPGAPFDNDVRMPNEEVLEKYFAGLGYEVCYAEDFSDGADQVRYFNNTKVLVGTTGAGLTNMVFMNPGSIVIELAVPVGNIDEFGGWEFSVHGLYKDIALCKNIIHVSIGSMKDPNLVIDLIDKNKYLKELIIND